MQTYLISKTAVQNGTGTDMWKTVNRMTDEERAAARAGTPVYFQSFARSGGAYGTYWRQAVPKNGRFVPRVPDAQTVAMLDALI